VASSGGENEMDINLTGQIAATMAENLKQPWYSTLTGVLGGIVASLTTLAGVWITQKNEAQKKKRTDQLEAHSNLQGCAQTLLQSLRSYFLSNIAARGSQSHAKLTAFALIDLTPAKQYLKDEDTEAARKYINKEFKSELDESVDLKESLRLRARSESLELKIGDVKERFWKYIDQIKTSFNDTRINDFIHEMEKAEAQLAELDDDICNKFSEIENKIHAGFSEVCFDKIAGKKYAANSPNENRNALIDKMTHEIEKMRRIMGDDARVKISILDSKINDLLNYTNNILDNPTACRDCNLFCSSKTCPLKPPSQ
jgi:hypothetical protein